MLATRESTARGVKINTALRITSTYFFTNSKAEAYFSLPGVNETINEDNKATIMTRNTHFPLKTSSIDFGKRFLKNSPIENFVAVNVSVSVVENPLPGLAIQTMTLANKNVAINITINKTTIMKK